MPADESAVRTAAVRHARNAWELFQAADGCGVVLTDDDLLADFLADRFGVRPGDVIADYSPDEPGDTV
jgi:hypothetical protein